MSAQSRKTMLVALAAVLFAGCSAGGDATADGAAAGTTIPLLRVVLPPTEAPRLFSACDGNTVKADSLWAPGDSLLLALDARLAQHLRTTVPESSDGDPLRDYSRQYLGLYRGGQRLIFVNGVHQSYLRGAADLDSAGTPPAARAARVEEWFRSPAVSVCDGGKAFFRAEYDVSTDRIAQFAFNGYDG